MANLSPSTFSPSPENAAVDQMFKSLGFARVTNSVGVEIVHDGQWCKIWNRVFVCLNGHIDDLPKDYWRSHSPVSFSRTCSVTIYKVDYKNSYDAEMGRVPYGLSDDCKETFQFSNVLKALDFVASLEKDGHMDYNPQQAEIDKLFAQDGYTKAGGCWGDAQWKFIDENTLVSIGGSYGFTLPCESDYTSAPINPEYPCMVYVYHGPFHENSKVIDGDAPHNEEEDCIEPEMHEVKNAYEALAYVKTLKPHVVRRVLPSGTVVRDVDTLEIKCVNKKPLEVRVVDRRGEFVDFMFEDMDTVFTACVGYDACCA